MYFLRIIFLYFAFLNISDGKEVQGIIGRNVSFSWIFKNVRNDDVFILHNESHFHQVLPPRNHSRQHALPERVSVLVSNTTTDNITVTVAMFNITENDAGKYRVIREWKYQDLDDSVYLKTIDETNIPKIAIAGHNILNSTIVLECRSSSLSAGDVFWEVNDSMIGIQGRYSQNNSLLSIKNLTLDDQYNVYKCNDSRSGLESDPYSINISGPNFIKFSPNITMVQEYSGLNVSCLADCYPVCSWKWKKVDLSLSQDNVISTNNALRIQNVTRQDTGIYSCGVLNIITLLSLENVKPLQIVYGPDVISFNTSATIIQLDENDSITISCSADCFPPCQIGWTETNSEILIKGAEKKLENVNRSWNYTCHATNARNGNATITDTVSVIIKSGINHYTTKAMTSQGDTEEFPFKRHLLYILLGTGIILAVSFLTCRLHKIRIRLHVDKVSTSNTFRDSMKYDADVQEEIQPSSYWTIVSNAEGELSSAIETKFERGIEQHPIGQNVTYVKNESNRPVRFDDVKVNDELDGYLNPIQSPPLNREDYIHPIHLDKENSDFVPKRHSAVF